MIQIATDLCIGCGRCAHDCNRQMFRIQDGKSQIATEDECLLCGHCVAICPRKAISITEYDMSEVEEYRPNMYLDPDALLGAIKFRRSIRHFTPAKVEREKIDQIIEAGRYTPTGSNSQNVSYVIVEKEIALLEEMGLTAYRRWQAEQLATGIIEAPGFDIRNSKLEPGYFFKNASLLILTTSPSLTNACLASTSMELMAEALGLGVLYVGLFTRAINYDATLKQHFGLAEDEYAATCLVIGYPNVHYMRTAPRFKPTISWR